MPIIGVIASSAKGAPGIPTGVTATDVGTARAFNNGAASVAFTPGAGATATSFTVTSSPGGFTATGASSPLTVTGLQSSVGYTYTVTATNAAGTSAASAASASVTATTVPQAPTIGTATASINAATVTYTAGATGGKAVSTYTATSSPGSFTGTGASPITVSGLTNGTAYTFTVTATNANGTSIASAASNSVTPNLPSLGAWSAFTAPSFNRNYPGFAQTSSNIHQIAGNNGGPKVDSFYYNGSSYTNYNFPVEVWRGMAGWDGTYVQHSGGFDTANNGQTWNYYATGATGTSWTAGTSLPNTTEATFGGAIGNAIIVFDRNSPTKLYYRTGVGAWSNGSTYPGTPSNTYGTATQTRGNYFTMDNATNVLYELTSPTGGFTARTALPNMNGSMGTMGAQNYGSVNVVWYLAGNNAPPLSASYRWNSSSNTWATQTATPTNLMTASASGIIGSTLYGFVGATSPGTSPYRNTFS
jgi:trimeric autotransporter adhesin